MLKKSDQVHQLMNPPTNLRTWTVSRKKAQALLQMKRFSEMTPLISSAASRHEFFFQLTLWRHHKVGFGIMNHEPRNSNSYCGFH